MATLSEEQREYLDQHNIPADIVFDATGLRRKDWQSQMKQLGLRFAFGVGPCKKGNHSLRSASGNCIQCEPANIAFTNRNYDDGHVYIAYSMEEELLKVGVAKSVKMRINSLNNLGYAGATDWKVLHSVKVKRAGEVEFAIHADLAPYNESVTYLRDGNPVDCREVFRCNIDMARHIFEKHTGSTFMVDPATIELFIKSKSDNGITQIEYESDEQEAEPWLSSWRGEEGGGNDEQEAEPWLRSWRGEDGGGNDDQEDEPWIREWRLHKRLGYDNYEYKSDYENATQSVGREISQYDWGDARPWSLEICERNTPIYLNDICSFFVVSTTAVEAGVRFGFTNLNQSKLKRWFQKRYPKNWVAVWHFKKCVKHNSTEDIIHANINHLPKITDGFFKIQPLSGLVSLCEKILKDIDDQ
jgi:hypothetical protein